jgi:hypothetical protein
MKASALFCCALAVLLPVAASSSDDLCRFPDCSCHHNNNGLPKKIAKMSKAL